jgi:hypothetical protein
LNVATLNSRDIFASRSEVLSAVRIRFLLKSLCPYSFMAGGLAPLPRSFDAHGRVGPGSVLEFGANLIRLCWDANPHA